MNDKEIMVIHQATQLVDAYGAGEEDLTVHLNALETAVKELKGDIKKRKQEDADWDSYRETLWKASHQNP